MKESADDLALKKRQRNQTNYNEAAYQQQLEAALTGENASEGNSDDESDDDDYAASTHRVSWTKANENDWNLSEAESLSEHLLSFGYGNFEWAAVNDRLGLKDISVDEVRRMLEYLNALAIVILLVSLTFFGLRSSAWHFQ